MAQAGHLESLLSRIAALRDQFGRAAGDLDAICSRARSSDFRGVLQNARVVTETLLRSIVHREKGHAPGKDTLEKLIPKLFQEGKPSILPTHIVVHVRTIQAWGNVGAHDQAGDLFAEGLEMKEEEALAALNSLVAILEWYQEKYLADGSTPSTPQIPADAKQPAKASSAPSRPASVASAPSSPAAPAPSGSKMPVIAGIGGLAVVGLAAAFFLSGDKVKTQSDVVVKEDGAANAEARAALNRAYLAAHEYPPPKTCETNNRDALDLFLEIARLLEGGGPASKRAEDHKAVEALKQAEAKHGKAAEFWYLMARAHHFAGGNDADVRAAADKAIELCKTYAPPYNMHGNLGLLKEEVGFAKLSYQKAAELAPEYLSPAFNLGLIALQDKRVEEAISAFTKVLQQDPEYAVAYQARATAHLASGKVQEAARDLEELTKRQPKNVKAFELLGQVKMNLGKKKQANDAFCKAKALGSVSAAKQCK